MVPLLFAMGLLVVAIFMLQFFSNKRYSPKLPCGTMGWPLIGETLSFVKPHVPNSIGFFLYQRCSMYGRVFKSHLFGYPTIVSCDHDLNQFILQNEDKLFVGSYPKAIIGILGKSSLLTSSGDLHKRLRNHLIRFPNTYKSNPDYIHDIERLSLLIMKPWSDGDEVIFHKETRKFLFYLTIKQVLSVEPEEPLGMKILDDFLKFMKGFVSLPINLPGTAFYKAVKARGRISCTLIEIIRERRKGGIIRGDFLDELLSNSNNVSDEEIVCIVMDILLGGYETTSTLLALIAYFVGQAPNVLYQLQMEHQSIRANKGDKEPLDFEDYKKMTFTSNVIWEAMRCGNVVKFLHREALQDVMFKEYLIPAGWKVLPVLSGGHLDPSLHQDPSKFNPWRWEDPTLSKRVSPFGGGPRLCPGIELAKLGASVFLHHLVLNYRWTLKGDFPLSYPFVEFQRCLPLQIQRITL